MKPFFGETAIIYPSSDGQPMADNTRQFNWITFLKTNIESRFLGDEDVFVAGDLLWYPVEGEPKINTAPDVLVVLGRPKGDRRSYIQHREQDIPPQVVFEVISDSNRRNPAEMTRKFQFYERYGVEEYFILDPDSEEIKAFFRQGENLEEVPVVFPFQSPRLGITFDWVEDKLRIYYPNGFPFEHFEETQKRAEREKRRAENERQKAREERQKAQEERQKAENEKEIAEEERVIAETERQKAETERQKAETERLAKEKAWRKLRELGIDPQNL
jgi:Uma2 family endonuclease